MAMLVGVATDKIEQFLEPLVAGEMQTAAQWAGGHAIQGEDIDIETAEVTQMGTLDEGGVGSLDLAEGQGVGGIILGADQFEGGGEPFGMGDEPLIVFAWHGHIGIIVQGMKPLWRTAPSIVPAQR